MPLQVKKQQQHACSELNFMYKSSNSLWICPLFKNRQTKHITYYIFCRQLTENSTSHLQFKIYCREINVKLPWLTLEVCFNRTHHTDQLHAVPDWTKDIQGQTVFGADAIWIDKCQQKPSHQRWLPCLPGKGLFIPADISKKDACWDIHFKCVKKHLNFSSWSRTVKDFYE